jgi:DNA modification methylase/ParB-like chromosome segregation protein Spo0J
VREVITIPVNDVIFREDLYPRLERDPGLVQRYAEDLDVLPPIEVNQHRELIDGWHRWTAFKKQGRETIPTQVTQTASANELFELAAARNARFGRQLSPQEKKRIAERLHPRLSVEAIAAILSVCPRRVEEHYLADQKRERTRRRNELILRHAYQPASHGACAVPRSQEEIARLVSDELGEPVLQRTVSNVLARMNGGCAEGRRFEQEVNQRFGATKPAEDGGVDGITPEGVGIQTTLQAGVGRQKVDLFAAGLRRRGLTKGKLVGRYVGKGARHELDRLRHEEGIDIEFVPAVEILGTRSENASLARKHEAWFFAYLACLAEVADLPGEQDRSQWADEVALTRETDVFGIDFQPKIYSLWSFPKLTNGARVFGSVPQEILENLLYYYTRPFDVVFDPFAGGGMTIDVCKRRYRRYFACDLNPIAERQHEIRRHDITTGLPAALPVPDLVFLDPPYWKQAEGKYSQDQTDLGNVGLETFLNAIGEIAKNVKRKWTKQHQGKLALIIGPWKQDGRYVDLPFLCYQRIAQYLSLVQRITVPYSTEIHGGAYVERAKQKKEILYLTRDLMVFGDDHSV